MDRDANRLGAVSGCRFQDARPSGGRLGDRAVETEARQAVFSSGRLPAAARSFLRARQMVRAISVGSDPVAADSEGRLKGRAPDQQADP